MEPPSVGSLSIGVMETPMCGIESPGLWESHGTNISRKCNPHRQHESVLDAKRPKKAIFGCFWFIGKDQTQKQCLVMMLEVFGFFA